jgi:hypothetical protein
MIVGWIVQLATVAALLLACGTGETPAPRLPRILIICLGAEAWNTEEFRLEP